jgi:hypothetical protein
LDGNDRSLPFDFLWFSASHMHSLFLPRLDGSRFRVESVPVYLTRTLGGQQHEEPDAADQVSADSTSTAVAIPR